jgi:hypothetical protein
MMWQKRRCDQYPPPGRHLARNSHVGAIVHASLERMTRNWVPESGIYSIAMPGNTSKLVAPVGEEVAVCTAGSGYAIRIRRVKMATR